MVCLKITAEVNLWPPHTCACAHTHVPHIYIYIYIYTHTHTHTSLQYIISSVYLSTYISLYLHLHLHLHLYLYLYIDIYVTSWGWSSVVQRVKFKVVASAVKTRQVFPSRLPLSFLYSAITSENSDSFCSWILLSR